MFEGEKYITRGVQSKISLELQIIMFQMIEDLKREGIEIDYLQVFRLKKITKNKEVIQVIEHTQEVPEYNRKIEVRIEKPVQEKVFVISSNSENRKEYSTMMIADEY
ncbi:MAG: DUF960 domain-containing protein [Tepidibacter sp.]|jgi:hypothetical protein|uniref:DUF960 family protein n=1 Tax=Tepidibacter sp. TaxID=2529387 RepID=UPI0025FB4909|nr:DUF960 family protein [Tepidibacter sp.]MCT4509510.1 DUF960 domain-containing protein [Tepidibacter sp.]